MIGREQRFHPEYSAMEKTYIALFGVPVVGLRIRARKLMRLLPAELIPLKILDAGSGPGVITFQLAKQFSSASVIGIDTVKAEIEACRIISEKSNIRNVYFKVADIRDLEYENTFDLIVCVDILEHIEDDSAALAKLFRALTPGGILYLHVPALYRRYPIFKKSLNFDVPTHVRSGYNMEDVAAKAEKTGFTLVESGKTYGFLETLANNISYMVTGARKKNREIYALVFPLLNLISWLGRYAKPENLGAGIYFLLAKSEKPTT